MHKQFVRNKKNQIIGVLTARMEDQKLKFGWSMHTDQSTHNKENGLDVASGRMDSCTVSFLNRNKPSSVFNLPHSLRSDADNFIKRVRKTEKRHMEQV